MSSSILFLIFSMAHLPSLAMSSSELIEGSTGLSGCYTSIFNFGDSVTDTGNHLYAMGDSPINIGRLPYGETFFHYPTGRSSDGRLVIDFIAEAFGISHVPPYLPSRGRAGELLHGANFAVAGSTALDVAFLSRQGVSTKTNDSLSVQIEWFKDFLPSLCNNKADCKEALNQSLFMVNMEGNDYNYVLSSENDVEELSALLPPVINCIRSAVEGLIELGATSVVASGMVPIGCLTAMAIKYSPKEEKPACVGWINDFIKKHNVELQIELSKVHELHPDVTIIYADYYSATIPIYDSPAQFGFTNGPFRVCCGGGGFLNYNPSDDCEHGEVKKSCGDPSTYVNWDGMHLTEAAYEVIAGGLLQGSCNPTIMESCPRDKAHLPLVEQVPMSDKAKAQVNSHCFIISRDRSLI